MENARAWAEQPGATAQERLSLVGITNAADQEAVLAAWDEDTVVDVALKNRAYGVFSCAVAGKFSQENKTKLKAALLAEKTPCRAACRGRGMRLWITTASASSGRRSRRRGGFP